MFFQRLNTHRYSPILMGTMSAECFLAKKGTDGSAVGRGFSSWRLTTGKQRYGTALASNRQPCESFRSPQGTRPKATQNGGGSQPEERHGLAAAVLRITRRRKSTVRGVLVRFGFPIPNIFCGSATRSRCPTHPSPSRYPVIDRLPHAMCVGLS
jgi:hypothetical protein